MSWQRYVCRLCLQKAWICLRILYLLLPGHLYCLSPLCIVTTIFVHVSKAIPVTHCMVDCCRVVSCLLFLLWVSSEVRTIRLLITRHFMALRQETILAYGYWMYGYCLGLRIVTIQYCTQPYNYRYKWPLMGMWVCMWRQSCVVIMCGVQSSWADINWAQFWSKAPMYLHVLPPHPSSQGLGFSVDACLLKEL